MDTVSAIRDRILHLCAERNITIKRHDYDQKAEKTNNGELVSSYMCSPETAAEEFEISKLPGAVPHDFPGEYVGDCHLFLLSKQAMYSLNSSMGSLLLQEHFSMLKERRTTTNFSVRLRRRGHSRGSGKGHGDLPI